MATLGYSVISRESTDPAGLSKSFELLNYELQAVAVEAELCLVGGAVMIVAFNAKPDTRRVRALFKPIALVLEASARVAETLDLPPEWLNDGVRRHLEAGMASGSFVADSNLKVYAARPDYVLALKCASIPFETGPGAHRDIRYLLRFLDILTVDEARSVIGRYFNERQLPADIDATLSDILD